MLNLTLRIVMYYKIELLFTLQSNSVVRVFPLILSIFNDTLMTMTGYWWYSFWKEWRVIV